MNRHLREIAGSLADGQSSIRTDAEQLAGLSEQTDGSGSKPLLEK